MRTQELTTMSDISFLNHVVYLRILCACWILLLTRFEAIIQTCDSELIFDMPFNLVQTRVLSSLDVYNAAHDNKQIISATDREPRW